MLTLTASLVDGVLPVARASWSPAGPIEKAPEYESHVLVDASPT